MRQDQFSPIGNLKLYFNKKYINEELLIHISYSRSNWLGFKYILLILKEIHGYENCPKIIVSFQSQKRWWTGWVISWNVTNFSLFVSKHNNSQFPHCAQLIILLFLYSFRWVQEMSRRMERFEQKTRKIGIEIQYDTGIFEYLSRSLLEFILFSCTTMVFAW